MTCVVARLLCVLTVCGLVFFFFFFQAEDGIRDGRVTGVQTCALPISYGRGIEGDQRGAGSGDHHFVERDGDRRADSAPDRKSTRLNSSHPSISYAVFCLKKKKKNHILYVYIITANMYDVIR